MWWAYRDRATNGEVEGKDIHRRSVLLCLLRLVTRGDQKRRSSLDYMLGALFHDNLSCVRRMVYQEVADVDTQYVLRKRIYAVIYYVKFYFSGHIVTDSDVSHDTLHALHGGVGDTTCATISHCNSYLLPFQDLGDVEKAMHSPPRTMHWKHCATRRTD